MSHVIDTRSSNGQFIVLGDSLTLPTSNAATTPCQGSIRFNPTLVDLEIYIPPTGWIPLLQILQFTSQNGSLGFVNTNGPQIQLYGNATGNAGALFLQTSGSTRMAITGAGLVGIGTTAPDQALTVNGSIDSLNFFLYQSTTTNSATYGFSNASGPAIQVWGNATAHPGNMLFLTSGSIKMALTNAGRLGIGTTAPDQALTVNGNIDSNNFYFYQSALTTTSIIGFSNTNGPQLQFWGNGTANPGEIFVNIGGATNTFINSAGITTPTLTQTSDISLKQNIRDINNALDIIGQMRGVRYELRSSPTETRIGVIAQEIKKIAPELVRKSKNIDKDNKTIELLGVNYTDALGLTINAIKELKSKLEKLEKAKTSKTSFQLVPYSVADIQNLKANAGMFVFATNGRKPGELVDEGTGVAAFYDGKAWVSIMGGNLDS